MADILQTAFLNASCYILIVISPNFIPMCPLIVIGQDGVLSVRRQTINLSHDTQNMLLQTWQLFTIV